MYELTIKINVYDGQSIEKSKYWLQAIKKIELPFVPYPKLFLHIHPKNYQIKDVVWFTEEKVFVCNLKEKFTTVGVHDQTFEDYSSEMLEYDWQIIGPEQIK